MAASFDLKTLKVITDQGEADADGMLL